MLAGVETEDVNVQKCLGLYRISGFDWLDSSHFFAIQFWFHIWLKC